jgi:hypothetical protein
MSIIFGVYGQKKIGYFTSIWRPYNKDTVADPLLTALKANSSYSVTYTDIGSQSGDLSSDPNLSQYDAIVIQESIDGASAVLTPSGHLAIAKLTKPTLYLKSYAFRGTRALPGANTIGTGGETANLKALKVEAANQTNPLFAGITFTNDTFQCFNQCTTDTATAGTKALNYFRANSGGCAITGANTLLAIPAGTLAHTDIIGCVNDIPAGRQIGTASEYVTTQARIITIGYNYGAMIIGKDRTTPNITADGLKLLTNAVSILANTTVNVMNAKATNFSIFYRNNNLFEIQFNKSQKAVELAVYNITGRLIERRQINGNRDIVNLQGKAKGVYLIKVADNTQKVIVE